MRYEQSTWPSFGRPFPSAQEQNKCYALTTDRNDTTHGRQHIKRRFHFSHVRHNGRTPWSQARSLTKGPDIFFGITICSKTKANREPINRLPPYTVSCSPVGTNHGLPSWDCIETHYQTWTIRRAQVAARDTMRPEFPALSRDQRNFMFRCDSPFFFLNVSCLKRLPFSCAYHVEPVYVWTFFVRLSRKGVLVEPAGHVVSECG